MGKSEEKIIRKAIAGDRGAFRTLVLEHSDAMYRLAWRMTSDQGIADDIVQEAFIKAWRKLETFKLNSSFRTWMHRITVNTALSYLRKQSRRQQFETEEREWVHDADIARTPHTDTQIDIQVQTEAAMQQLSELERSALLLRHFEGHSINEISQILELTNSACKQAIFRAVRKMRIALEPLVTT